MTNIFKTTAKIALTLSTLAFAGTAQAGFFDICKDIEIKLVNNLDEKVEVFDIDYYDPGTERWASEPFKNRVLSPGQSYTFERNLEGVKGTRSQIRAQYHKKDQQGKYVGDWRSWSKRKECKSGKTEYTVYIKN